MATVVELKGMPALCQLLANTHRIPVGVDHVEVNPYPRPGPIIDRRNGWTTYVVKLNGDAVGFTNGPLK